MSRVIEDGRGGGYVAGVDANGNVQTIVNGGTLETQRAAMERSENAGGAVSATTAGELVPAGEDRQSITFFVSGANPVRINFGEDDPTADDLVIGAGERLTLDVVGDEAVQAKAVGGDSYVCVWEWFRKSS